LKGFYNGITIDEFIYCIKTASFPMIVVQLVLSAFAEPTVDDFVSQQEKVRHLNLTK
jgi:hypothetical protein